jgi:hypothetical protein
MNAWICSPGARRFARIAAACALALFLGLIALWLVLRPLSARSPLNFAYGGITNHPNSGKWAAKVFVTNATEHPVQLAGWTYVDSADGGRATAYVVAYELLPHRHELLVIEVPTNQAWKLNMPSAILDFWHRVCARLDQASWVPQPLVDLLWVEASESESDWFSMAP